MIDKLLVDDDFYLVDSPGQVQKQSEPDTHSDCDIIIDNTHRYPHYQLEKQQKQQQKEQNSNNNNNNCPNPPPTPTPTPTSVVEPVNDFSNQFVLVQPQYEEFMPKGQTTARVRGHQRFRKQKQRNPSCSQL